MSELVLACATGNISAVQKALAAGVKPPVRNRTAWAPLHVAAAMGHAEIVRLLLDTGVDASARDARGRDALLLAALGGHARVAAALLTTIGAKSDYASARALRAAAQRGFACTTRSIATAGAPLSARDHLGRSPLLLAALSGELDVVRTLLVMGADPHDADVFGLLPIHAAALAGDAAIIAALAAGGGDVNHKAYVSARWFESRVISPVYDGVFYEALGISLCGHSQSHRRPLLAHAPLHLAAELGHAAAISALLAAGATVDAENSAGVTALALAAARGHADVVEALLADGASPSGWPLVLAVAARSAVLRALLAAGADATRPAPDSMSLTPLSVAAMVGDDPETVTQLLAAGAAASLNARVGPGLRHTALSLAASAGHAGCVRVLLAAGATIEILPELEPPLIAAVRACSLDATLALLTAGAHLLGHADLRNRAVGLAAARCDASLVSALLAAGATNDDSTVISDAFVVAVENLHSDTVRVLADTAAVSESAVRDGLAAAIRLVAEPTLMAAILAAANPGILAALARDVASVRKACTGCSMFAQHSSADNGACSALLATRAVDIEARGRDDDTPLMAAAFCGFAGGVRLLLEAGADPQAADSRGRTALVRAAEGGNAVVVALLLAAGASHAARGRFPPSYTNSAGFQAVATGFSSDSDFEQRPPTARSECPLAAEADRCSEWSALMFAAAQGRLDTASFLLAAGADPDDVDSEGWTAGMRAAERGYARLARLLLGQEQHPSIRFRDAVEAASGTDSLDVALLHAATQGDAASVSFLIARGANASAVGLYGTTALSLAASMGNVAALEVLLTAGADVNATNRAGWGPLMLAALGGHARAARTLVKARAAVAATDSVYRATPLCIASSVCAAEVIAVLATVGASTETSCFGRSAQSEPRSSIGGLRRPIEHAIDGDCSSTVRVLLDAGAAHSRIPKSESFPLVDRAACAGHAALVRLLI